MNKVKVYTFTGTIAELKKRLAERVEEEKVEKFESIEKGIREALDKQQEAETLQKLNDLVKPIETFLERYYKMFPHYKPNKNDIKRPFNLDRIDHDFQEEKDRKDYDNRREEFETGL